MADDDQARRRRELTRQRVARYRQRQQERSEVDASTARFLAGKLLDRWPEAARILAREVPSEHAEAIIAELQRSIAEDSP